MWSLADDGQGLRSGESCSYVIVIRQITEKSIKYNRSAFMGIDLKKAFEQIQLKNDKFGIIPKQLMSGISI